MIIAEGWVRLKGAEEVDRLRGAALEMMRATKSEESGCLEYAYAIDMSDNALLRVIERWTDEAALSAHFATPHMAAFGRAMSDAKIEAALVNAYAGDHVRTLMAR